MKTLIKKAVLVGFENYYSRLQYQLVIGTISKKRAIEAVRKDQGSRKCDVKSCIIYKNIDASGIIFDLDYALTV